MDSKWQSNVIHTISAKWSKLEIFFTSLTRDLHNILQITIEVMYSVPAVLNGLSTIMLNNKGNVWGGGDLRFS